MLIFLTTITVYHKKMKLCIRLFLLNLKKNVWEELGKCWTCGSHLPNTILTLLRALSNLPLAIICLICYKGKLALCSWKPRTPWCLDVLLPHSPLSSKANIRCSQVCHNNKSHFVPKHLYEPQAILSMPTKHEPPTGFENWVSSIKSQQITLTLGTVTSI